MIDEKVPSMDTLKSFKVWLSHMVSYTTTVMPLYSASMVDNATIRYFQLLQEITHLPKEKLKPNVNCQQDECKHVIVMHVSSNDMTQLASCCHAGKCTYVGLAMISCAPFFMSKIPLANKVLVHLVLLRCKITLIQLLYREAITYLSVHVTYLIIYTMEGSQCVNVTTIKLQT